MITVMPLSPSMYVYYCTTEDLYMFNTVGPMKKL